MDGGGDDRYDRQIEGRIRNLEEDMENLKAWRNYVVGAVGTLGLLIGAYAKQVATIVKSIIGGP